MTAPSTTLLSLACGLVEITGRVDAAERLARHVGASSLRVFVPDVQLKLLVAAPGFPSTIPQGEIWAAFLGACGTPGVHQGEVTDGEANRLVPATAYVDGHGTVLVFVGASLTIEPGDFALPLLGALFRAEQGQWAATGQAAASQEAARHANALTTALDGARGDLERAVQTKQQLLKDREMLLGVVGHDLRNPLNTVVVGASLLIEVGDFPPSHLKTLQRIKNTGQRMARMIADLLDFERSRGGAMPVTRTDVCLRDVVTQVVEEIEVGNPARVLELNVRADGRGSWDADRFAQVISNLVGNALQHSPADTPVSISLLDTADSVVIEVTNVPREAISEEDLKQMFEPFRRGQKSTGLGLGLYIVQQIAKAHGGTVVVRSQNERTTFSVEVPRRMAGADRE